MLGLSEGENRRLETIKSTTTFGDSPIEVGKNFNGFHGGAT